MIFPSVEIQVRRARARGLRPVEVRPGRWLALCPCCGRLDLVLGDGAMDEAPSEAERDIWLDNYQRSAA